MDPESPVHPPEFNEDVANNTPYNMMAERFSGDRDVIEEMIALIDPLLILIADLTNLAPHGQTATQLLALTANVKTYTPIGVADRTIAFLQIHNMCSEDPDPLIQFTMCFIRPNTNDEEIDEINIDLKPIDVLQPLRRNALGRAEFDESFSDKLSTFVATVQTACVSANRRRSESFTCPSPARAELRGHSSADLSKIRERSISPRVVNATSPCRIADDFSLESPMSSPDAYARQTRSPKLTPTSLNIKHVSWFIVLHGEKLYSPFVEYKTPSRLNHVNFDIGDEVCASTIGNPLRKIEGSYAIVNAPGFEGGNVMRTILGLTGDRCVYDVTRQSIALQPLIFYVEPKEREELLRENSIGIWRFDHMDDNVTVTRTPILRWKELVQFEQLDKGYCTYMRLFGLINKDLKDLIYAQQDQHKPTDFTCNIVFHCCRTGGAYRHPLTLFKQIRFGESGTPVYACPPDVALVKHLPPGSVVQMFVRHMTRPLETMPPLLQRNIVGGVHVNTQGCLYNVLTYLGIITPDEGNILTAMQSVGVTSQTFINLMQTQTPLPLDKYGYAIERHFPIIGGLRRLRVLMTGMEQTYRDYPGHFHSYAVFVKLYWLQYKPNTQIVSDNGHWCLLTINDTQTYDAISRNGFIPWRFVDPQGLSVRVDPATGARMTVPMTFHALNDQAAMDAKFNELDNKFQAIDLFFVVKSVDATPVSFGAIVPDLKLGGKQRNTKNKTKKNAKKNKTKRKCNKNKNKNKMTKYK